MTSAATLSLLSRDTLNEAVSYGWLRLPDEMQADWVYVETVPGVRGEDDGRAQLILQRRRDYCLFAIPFYESTGESDMYQDRFRGQEPQMIPVVPVSKMVRVTEYRPASDFPQPQSADFCCEQTHPHID